MEKAALLQTVQYIRSKRATFGVNLYVLCPSDKDWNGYSWNIDLYYNKDSYEIEDESAFHLSVSEGIVVFMMKDLLNEGRYVITDNWYTSLRLTKYLEEKPQCSLGFSQGSVGHEIGDSPNSICKEGQCPYCEMGR